jgi:hypothetical protein
MNDIYIYIYIKKEHELIRVKLHELIRVKLLTELGSVCGLGLGLIMMIFTKLRKKTVAYP